MKPTTGEARTILRGAGPNPSLTKRALSPALGVEILRIDLRQTLAPATIAALRAAWHEHLVLLFRDQSVSEDDQARFGEYFGTLVDMSADVPKTAEKHHYAVIFISNIRENGTLLGTLPDGEVFFHSDSAYRPHPPIGTMLFAMEIPSVGGNTLFANMYAAYDALPHEDKDRIGRLKALNFYDLNYDADGAPCKRMERLRPDAPSCLHPMVKVHPATGRRAIYVNRLMTYKVEGLSPDESDALLNYLFDHQEQPQFRYEHVWRPGDLLLWDNRGALHARTDFAASERRLLRRMTLRAAALA
jgi:taurine dioxygenase